MMKDVNEVDEGVDEVAERVWMRLMKMMGGEDGQREVPPNLPSRGFGGRLWLMGVPCIRANYSSSLFLTSGA